MKLHRLLAISIFLAHNAWAGWHTNEPFVAWPATNHLRWVNGNTNAPVWTNSAYGGWTNNYVATNLYLYDSGYGKLAFPLPVDAAGTLTNYRFNAKDVRLLDCLIAAAERAVVSYPGTYTMSNVYSTLAFDYWGDATHSGSIEYFQNFFRNERMSLQNIKAVIKNEVIASGVWIVMTNATEWVTLTEAMVCSNAAVPPNFLRYTPPRVADMTVSAYSRILTNSWTLSTTNSGTVTNTFIDSFSESHSLAGTNGQQFTLVVTNANHAEGWPITAYGWDGLRRVITNFSITARGNTWGIGYGTNAVDSFKSNGPCNIVSAPITPILVPLDQVPFYKIDAWNGWALDPWITPPYSAWFWSDTTGSPLIQTGAAPSAVWTANYNINFDCSVTYEGNAGDTNWTMTSYSTNNFMAHTNQWKDYKAPLWITTDGPVSRDLDYYAKTGGTSVLIWSTNAVAGRHSVTSPLYNVSIPPPLASFGASNNVIVAYGYLDGWPATDGWASWHKYTATPYPPYTPGFSGSTNMTFPAVTAHATLEKWNFEYK